jgi:hypothetical protein
MTPSGIVTVIQADTWWQLTPMQRHDLREWMKANDLPAPLIPAQEPVTVENGDTIRYTRLMIDKDGQPTYKDGKVVCEEVTTPLKTAPGVLPGSTFTNG